MFKPLTQFTSEDLDVMKFMSSHSRNHSHVYDVMRDGDRIDADIIGGLTRTRETIVEIANANAIFAVDNLNSRDYRDTRGRCTAIDAHAQNVMDTLLEKGLIGCDREALAVYYGKVAELLRDGM